MLDGLGAVKAMVGGKSYRKSQFNRATKAKRQPGSAFKPFVYLAAIEQGYRPDTVEVDEPVRIGNWQPENYRQKYLGPVTLETAFALSLNTIAAKLVMLVGPRAGCRDGAPAWHHVAAGQRCLDRTWHLGSDPARTHLRLRALRQRWLSGDRPIVVTRISTRDGQLLYERHGDRAIPRRSPTSISAP